MPSSVAGGPLQASSASAVTPVVVFDAMGVLYAEADDEADVLTPYLVQLGCAMGEERIRDFYRRASSGEWTSTQFWAECGVVGDDHEYCGRHRLMPGIDVVLRDLSDRGVRMACLSNDVSAWSILLRERFALTRWIDVWAISADIRVRKPSLDAYRQLSTMCGVGLDQLLFFDDRPANVDAALSLGIDAHLFTTVEACRHTLVSRGLLV
ncbi:MAG: HAD-IA family hydrolase [Propionibacteriaceae bacterium]|nr:HAD-IA family hydrolase [Propionibacteriaceae bacterium]